MDQQKIGEFLKTLRKDKNLTQEELADKMNVSRRTVSRWETGSNLPDLSILVELADLYDVDMREIFNGERKNETMDKDLKETMLMAADYTDDNMKNKIRKFKDFKDPYVVIIGDSEAENEQVSINIRGNKQANGVPLEKFVEICRKQNTEYTLELVEEF